MKHLFFLLSAFILLSCGGTKEDENGSTEEKAENPAQKPSLPYIGLHDVDYIMKDGERVPDTIYHTVPPYVLLAHDSSEFSNLNVEGKIHVANFFFTSCPAICPAMIEQMKRLQAATEDIEELTFLSHTIDPIRDTIPRLQNYIAERNLDTHNWFFLYGDKETVYTLGEDGYMINAMEDEYAEGGFLHSEHFVLVDRSGHIRGLYTGTDPVEVDQLEKDIRFLLKEEYGN
ncbi:MAG: SCO family protein [Flavobacteriales bacterium]|jgi:protein SCO1/2|nr:SCO family protein [Flavobacteriales bacterium]